MEIQLVINHAEAHMIRWALEEFYHRDVSDYEPGEREIADDLIRQIENKCDAENTERDDS